MTESKLSPSMDMYAKLKEMHPEGLMLYQIGDFYEMFFEDALKASSVLGIALTRKRQTNHDDIPMCGVPLHSADAYIRRLVTSGFSVVLCQQSETPEEAKKKRGSSAIINRHVIRVITPGTLTEDEMLEPKVNSFLACLVKCNKQCSVSWVDISTGDFFFTSINSNEIINTLTMISPKELLISVETLESESVNDFLKKEQICVTSYPSNFFDTYKCERSIMRFFDISTILGFGSLSNTEISACGALVEYISITQLIEKPKLYSPKKHELSNYVFIDYSAVKSLEIFKTASGEKFGSLIHAIDTTVTACGGRMLAALLRAPMRDVNLINSRLDAVELLVHNRNVCESIRKVLCTVPDFERSLSRISVNRAMIKDLDAIVSMISAILELSLLVVPYFDNALLRGIYNDLGQYDSLDQDLIKAINLNFLGNVKDGGFVRESYSEKLDKLRSLKDKSADFIVQLRLSYQRMTGISSLKILKNNIIGLYIEVPSSCVLNDEKFHLKQTMSNCLRYTTLELKELENEILSSESSAIALELEIFKEICSLIMSFSEKFKTSARAIAELDVITSFAFNACEYKYSRPIIINDNRVFEVEGGRHPVLEKKGAFITNDLILNAEKFIGLITGPNMAGKSTFLRQNAIIAIMAHIGSFVPASCAKIGIIDKIFSRVGASDDISMGYSTFMMEMIEIASIVNRATSDSFVIVDEIGRGTAVYDGLAIAWSIVEHIHNINKCRSLFSTHYHDLAQLKNDLPSIKCLCVRVEECNGSVIFLYSVKEGVSNRSYGINVAKMAGMPTSIIERSTTIMNKLGSSSGLID